MTTAPSSDHPDPGDWARRYDEYLATSAGRSARTLELYQDLMAAVSRGELAPTIMQELSASFAQARGTAYASELAALSSRFFTGLVELGSGYARDLVDAIAPGTMPPVAPPPPPTLDGADWAGWFSRLTDYATRQGTAALQAYQSLLDRVAAGEVPPSAMSQTSQHFLETRLPDHLRRLVTLCFELLSGLDDIRNRYSEEFLEGVLETGPTGEDDALFALDLVAPVGSTTSASLWVTNTEAEPTVVDWSVPDVRRSDGVGPSFVPDVSITPASVELAPGEDAQLVVSVLLDADRYEPDHLYLGALRVTGGERQLVEVPLRIRAVGVGTRSDPPADGEAP
jgi:hypothetical protein